MTNHASRSKYGPKYGKVPKPDEIARAREKAGLTQEQAAEVARISLGTWRDWEQGRSAMHAGAFELFMLRTGQMPLVIVGALAPPDSEP